MAGGLGRTLTAVAAFMTMLSASGEAAQTTIRARFSFDGLATCQQPAVTNFPIHVEGTGALSTDRTATCLLYTSPSPRDS